MKRQIQVVPGYDYPWESPGIQKKPAYCQNCPLGRITTGFCADPPITGKKVAAVFSYPTNDDSVNQEPLSGAYGWWLYNQFFKGAGFSKFDILASHVIRCLPPLKAGIRQYPTGQTKTRAESCCRHYDNQHSERGKMMTRGIADWQPNIFIITFDPKDVRKVSAYHEQIVEDVMKAWRFHERGFRPAILFGRDAANMFAPQTKGQLKFWRGSYVEGAWPSNF